MDGPVPKVSIIIPAYNHAAWIEQTLASVFAQSFHNWELIIIDDASSDETWALIQTLLEKYNSHDNYARVSAVQHAENQGAPVTLNEGLSLAKGEFIAILNSDDAWHENRLERLHQHAEQASLDFVATGVKLWDEHSRLKNASEPHWLAWYQKMYISWKKHGDFLHALLRGNFLISTSNFFFRRALYERLGGFAELSYVHDYEYALRIYNAGAQMECLWDEALLNYRLHDNNTIRERPLAAIQENMQMLLGFAPKLSQQLNASRLNALHTQLGEVFQYCNEEWEAEVHWSLVGKEKELFSLIEDRDTWVSERDAIINEQRQHIEEREAWVIERDGWVAERDALNARLQGEVALQQSWVQERESWLSDRDEMISKRDQWVAERDAWIAERDGWIADRDQLIGHLQAEHEQVVNSWSYKLGSSLLNPFRILTGRFRARKWGPEHA